MGLVSELQTWFEIDPNGFFVAVSETGNFKKVIF